MTECFIVSKANPKFAFGIEKSSKDKGAKLVLVEHTGSDDQVFIIENTTIRSKNSGLVLDIEGGEEKGHNVIQWEENNGPNQKWYWHFDGSIRSEHGLALDASKGKIEEGVEIIAYSFHGGDNQQWRIIKKE